MKRFLVFFFLMSYLFSTTELHQLLKSPFLFQHFYEHKQQNQRLSIVDFLENHYFKNIKDTDYEKDMQLPFKNFQDNHPNIVLVLPKEILFFEPLLHFSQIFETNFKRLSQFVYSFHYSIWQPPKIAYLF